MSKQAFANLRKDIPIWWKYALSYLFVLIIPVVVFISYFNHYITSEMEKDISETMQSTLGKLQMNFDQKVEQISAISALIQRNRNFRASALIEFDSKARSEIQKTLLSFEYTNMFYDEIHYYQQALPQIVFTSLGTLNTRYYRTFLDEHSNQWLSLDQVKPALFQSGWILPKTVGSGRLNLKEALYYRMPLSDIPGGYLFFGLHESTIQQNLALHDDSEAYILQDDLVLYPFGASKPECLETMDTVVQRNNGRYQCAIKSKSTGLTYVYITQPSEIGAVARAALTGYMFLTTVVSLLCMLLIVGLSRRHAKPIDQLVTLSAGIAPDDVHGVARIQSAMNQLQNRSQELDEMRQASMRGHALIRLIRGRYHSEQEAEENLRRLDMTFHQPYRVIMLLQRDAEWEERDIQRDVTALLSRQHEVYGFAYAERSVFVLMVGMDTQDCESLVGELVEIAALPQLSASHIRFSLGGTFTNFTSAQRSFMQALSASRRNPGELVTIFREADEDELFYPREELQALGSALANLDRNRTAFLYDVLMSLIKKNNHIYFYTISLLTEMINLYLQALSLQSTDRSENTWASMRSEYINDADDMMVTLHKLHVRALQLMTESDLNCSVTEMTGIANYISACEELDTLSVSTVAERFGMNVSSLSHKFKEQMGCNISDYILTCKMNHACTMLRSTEETVADIAQKMGYSQYTSFVRTFKRLKGMTPTAYRDAWRRGENPV